MEQTNTAKSNQALREEAILAFWKENDIFKKSVEKNAGQKEFVFFEGPPTANAKPALHHLEARAFKDVIPRYKTMQGFHVPRRAGWDTHGLPIELQIEKKLGLQSKKDIEVYGIAAFNKECKDSVFTFIKDWEIFSDRIGYWVDQKNAYYTFNASYMESLWSIVGEIDKQGLLYKDYKVVPWCARCGTTLASHELAQGYQDDKDLSVYAKFAIKGFDKAYFIAWTTTPWTLPGNVALAVGADIDYVEAKVADEILVVAKERVSLLPEGYEIVAEHKGSEMAGMEYEPLYPYLASLDAGDEKLLNAYKVYVADFVTTTDGTGIVHTAVMYGAEDFELGTKVGLPKFHTVNTEGKFVEGTDFLQGRFVKDEDVAIDIIKDLAHRGLLFKKEKYEHSYPHCWRCKTPLIYYARDSWYIGMSKLRQELVAANETINWNPDHIKEGRFGEWLREAKDWAISRERYWGTPLPIWVAEDGEKVVVDSIDTLKQYGKTSGNTYLAVRHGEAEHNLTEVWSCIPGTNDALTEKGKDQVRKSAEVLKGKVDMIISSPFNRGQETAKIIAEEIGIPTQDIVTDARIGEWNVGSDYNGEKMDRFFAVRAEASDRYQFKTGNGESYADVFTRTGEFLYELESKYQGKRILVVTHGGSARAMELVAKGFAYDTLFETTRDYRNFNNAEVREISFIPLPHNDMFELDLHRPYIDEVVLEKDAKEFRRVKEVMDVWFDSGSMPFAQDHYPFEHKNDLAYPADFISEAIDQTRGWFYTMLSVGVLMRKGTLYKNVICLGHLLDKDGKKMSKSVGNIVEPFEQMDKFGVDAVRFWMYSVNQPGESKNYDEKSVAEINNKVFNLFGNVYAFYEQYRDMSLEGDSGESGNILDQWIMTRLNQLTADITNGLNTYDLFRPTRAIREFIDDLSTWYLRRSRDRLKDNDTGAKQTLYAVLKTTAQLLAPFAPFTAEDMWQKLKTQSDEESVHLTTWPKAETVNEKTIVAMQQVRDFCTQGNAIRKKETVPVRQPLQTFTISAEGLEDYYDLIKDELNVKNIAVGEVSFDMTITPELKLEGDYRELIRVIQDLRKEKGLMPQDIISLTLPAKYQEIIDTFGEELKKTVGAKELVINGEEIIIE